MGKNVAVFVDVANIFYAAKAAGVDIDYVTLLKSAIAGRDFVRAYAYTGLDPDNENQRNFHNFLARHDYKVVSKDIRKYGDGKVKANLDIELVVDMMKTARNLDVAIVVSGDGDFAPAIRAVQEMGVRVEVISFRGNTSSDLIDVADQFTDIIQMAKVEKGSSRSGRRVADDGEDLSMTEVPDKLTEGTGRGRGRRTGRGRGRTGEAEREPVGRRRRGRPRAAASQPARRGRAARSSRAAAARRRRARGAARARSCRRPPRPGSRRCLRPAGATRTAAADAASRRASGPEGGPRARATRRRRRRGGRGRGRGRGRDEAATPVGAPESAPTRRRRRGRRARTRRTRSRARRQRSARPAAGRVRIGLGLPDRPDAGRRPVESTPFDVEDEDEPAIPEYLIAEQRRGSAAAGAAAVGGRGGRGGRRPAAYASAMDRERYGRGGGGGGINRYPDVSGRPPTGAAGRPVRGGRGAPARRPSPGSSPRQERERPAAGRSDEPWSEVPPELEAMLRAQLAQPSRRGAAGRAEVAERRRPTRRPPSSRPRPPRRSAGAAPRPVEADAGAEAARRPRPAATPKRRTTTRAKADGDHAAATAAVRAEAAAPKRRGRAAEAPGAEPAEAATAEAPRRGRRRRSAGRRPARRPSGRARSARRRPRASRGRADARPDPAPGRWHRRWLTRGQPRRAGRGRRDGRRARRPTPSSSSGRPAVGKTTLAMDLAAGLLCRAADPADRPCRACRACRLVASRQPSRPPSARAGGARRPGRDRRPGRCRRGRAASATSLRELAFLPVEGGARVAIVEGAAQMNEDAQNALLKTLEEPPPAGHDRPVRRREELAPADRPVALRAGPARARSAPRDIEALLGELGLADAADAARLARLAEGRPGVAVAYARAPEAVAIRDEIARTPARPPRRPAGRDGWRRPGSCSAGRATWPRRSPAGLGAVRGPGPGAAVEPAARPDGVAGRRADRRRPRATRTSRRGAVRGSRRPSAAGPPASSLAIWRDLARDLAVRRGRRPPRPSTTSALLEELEAAAAAAARRVAGRRSSSGSTGSPSWSPATSARSWRSTSSSWPGRGPARRRHDADPATGRLAGPARGCRPRPGPGRRLPDVRRSGGRRRAASSGWVANEPDGSVRCVAEGPRDGPRGVRPGSRGRAAGAPSVDRVRDLGRGRDGVRPVRDPVGLAWR